MFESLKVVLLFLNYFSGSSCYGTISVILSVPDMLQNVFLFLFMVSLFEMFFKVPPSMFFHIMASFVLYLHMVVYHVFNITFNISHCVYFIY